MEFVAYLSMEISIMKLSPSYFGLVLVNLRYLRVANTYFMGFHIILMAYQFLSPLTSGLEEQQHESKIIMLDMKLI